MSDRRQPRALGTPMACSNTVTRWNSQLGIEVSVKVLTEIMKGIATSFRLCQELIGPHPTRGLAVAARHPDESQPVTL